jgi:hypothetical protein
LRARIERQAAAFACSWAGAFLASLFAAEPWVEAFDLRLAASFAYDDDGGMFLSYESAVSAIRVVGGMPLPDTVRSEDGVFDSDLAADCLGERFDAYERDLFVTLSDDFTGELTIAVKRERIATQLPAGQLSGADAFKALFPEWASRLG